MVATGGVSAVDTRGADRRRMISNAEVHAFLIQKKDEDNLYGEGFENLQTVKYEVLNYLSRTPASVQSERHIREFMAAMEPFGLTKGEKLNILNLRPGTEVDLFLIIEELASRLDTETREKLLMEIERTLPPPAA
ncbi:HRDC-like protein [Zopfochytrium polystomum]|nr:HRDC-like protein [Zopfochytrium polystomum]